MESIQRDVLLGFYKWQLLIKSFHFVTKYNVRHEAAGKYLDNFMEDYDKFMEVCMGHHGQMSMDNEYTIKIGIVNDDTIFYHIDKFGEFLNNLREPYEKHSDLLNILDEMVANLNRLVYLLKLK
jgi:hypothetical protein